MKDELMPNMKAIAERNFAKGCGVLFKSGSGIIVCGEKRVDGNCFLCDWCLKKYKDERLLEKEKSQNYSNLMDNLEEVKQGINDKIFIKEFIEIVKKEKSKPSDEYLQGWVDGKRETKERFKYKLKKFQKQLFQMMDLQGCIHRNRIDSVIEDMFKRELK